MKFEEFKSSLRGDTVKDLRDMAAKELGLSLPAGLTRDQVLERVFQKVSGAGDVDDRVASPSVPAPAPESSTEQSGGYRVKHMQPGGTNRAGRHWPQGPTVVDSLTEEQLKALEKDHRFTVVKL